jgi:hypothetical protein
MTKEKGFERLTPSVSVVADDWSDLRRFRPMPEIDFQRLDGYRKARPKSRYAGSWSVDLRVG